MIIKFPYKGPSLTDQTIVFAESYIAAKVAAAVQANLDEYQQRFITELLEGLRKPEDPEPKGLL